MVYPHHFFRKLKTLQIFCGFAVLTVLIAIGAGVISGISIKPSPSSLNEVYNQAQSTIETSQVPTILDNLPRGLKNPSIKYSGIYEDGWLSESASLSLLQPTNSNSLIIRGTIPSVGNQSFSSQIQVNIGNVFVGGKTLGVGDFELNLPSPTFNGVRDIQIYFSDRQLLPNGDNRMVGAQLNYIGFESRKDSPAELPRDITSKEISLGLGWYLPEVSTDTVFRWVNNQAELTIIASEIEDKMAIHLEIEPGPGAGSNPLELTILDITDKVIAEHTFTDRRTLQIPLPRLARPGLIYKLHTKNGGKLIQGENRFLNFRVFRLRLEKASFDYALKSKADH